MTTQTKSWTEKHADFGRFTFKDKKYVRLERVQKLEELKSKLEEALRALLPHSQSCLKNHGGSLGGPENIDKAKAVLQLAKEFNTHE